jgi:CxxC motif-containing protein (DUF1111 family)
MIALAACGSAAEEAATPPVAAAPAISLVTEDPRDEPIPGLSADDVAIFEAGDARFELPFRESQGLGPLYIHRSCTSCHEDDGRGPGTVRRIARVDPSAPELRFGDVVRPRAVAPATTPILAPEHPGVREVVRLPPALFARGYMEAIPDETIVANEAAQVGRDDGISGRVARLPSGAIGRFGHEARAPTLDAFVADALLGDMGLTSPASPDELPNPDGIADDARPGVDVSSHEIGMLANYVRLVALPRRAEPEVRGAAAFAEARCSVCHVATARTRRSHPFAALRDVEVALYTDLLLHDMGAGLDDGIDDGAAQPREWRTAPLVGIRHLVALLHDGRATTVREAIEAHASEGSEANDSVARFRALAEEDRSALVRFVEAL